MSVSIDTYNKAFKAFTDFALERVNANDGKAIASAKIDAPLGGRKMVAVSKRGRPTCCPSRSTRPRRTP